MTTTGHWTKIYGYKNVKLYGYNIWLQTRPNEGVNLKQMALKCFVTLKCFVNDYDMFVETLFNEFDIFVNDLSSCLNNS